MCNSYTLHLCKDATMTLPIRHPWQSLRAPFDKVAQICLPRPRWRLRTPKRTLNSTFFLFIFFLIYVDWPFFFTKIRPKCFIDGCNFLWYEHVKWAMKMSRLHLPPSLELTQFLSLSGPFSGECKYGESVEIIFF